MLAFDCELHPTYISQLERGVKSPTIRTLFLLAESMGVQPSEILRRVEDSGTSIGGPLNPGGESS
jgi:transcriptional regulator with XRE-family HTH domain